MAKMVGLNVVIKQGWIKKAVALLQENLTEMEYRKELEEHLAFEIDSPTNLRKARENLMKIWYQDTDGLETIQKEGRALIQKYPEELPAISWCMIPLSYPVFYDQARLMGKMFEFQDVITTTQIKNKLADEYGERDVISFSSGKTISTMRQLGCVVSEKVGQQKAGEINVKNEAVVNFMLKVAMLLGGSSYYSFSSLSEFPFLFPFKFKVSKEQLMNDDGVTLSTFDSNLSVGVQI